MDQAAVQTRLQEVAAGLPAERVGEAPPLRFGPLFAALTAANRAPEHPLAIELVYEGYLLHYRESRILARATPPETRLLAGDHFYAQGLHIVARCGDLDSVTLLTRLMGGCSYLRSVVAPFALDDDLWTVTVAAMAAAQQGCGPLDGLYRDFDEMIGRGDCGGLPAAVRRHAAALKVLDPTLLETWLSDPPGGGAPADTEVC
jgi:hypothetical protein